MKPDLRFKGSLIILIAIFSLFGAFEAHAKSDLNEDLSGVSGTSPDISNKVGTIRSLGNSLPKTPKAIFSYSGESGEQLLRAYFGDTRDETLADLVVYYPEKGDPGMVFLKAGKATDVLYNEARMWVLIFSEKEPKGKYGVHQEHLSFERKDGPVASLLGALHALGKRAPEEDVTASESKTPVPVELKDRTTNTKSNEKLYVGSARLKLTHNTVNRITITRPESQGMKRSSSFKFANVKKRLIGGGIGFGGTRLREGEQDPENSLGFFLFVHHYPAFLNCGNQSPYRRNLPIGFVAGLPLKKDMLDISVNDLMAGIRVGLLRSWGDIGNIGLIVGSTGLSRSGNARWFFGLDYAL